MWKFVVMMGVLTVFGMGGNTLFAEEEESEIAFEFGGEVSSFMRYFSSNQSSFEDDPEIDMAGTKDQSSRGLFVFDEAVLEAEVTKQSNEDWTTVGRLEITLSQEDGETEIDIDDASVGIQNSWFQFSFGILDDPADEFFLGEVDEFSVGEIENATIDNNVPGLRVGYFYEDELHIALTTRRDYNEGDREVPVHRQIQWRFDLEWEADWGLVQGVYDTSSSEVDDSKQFDNDPEQKAGAYLNQADLSHIVLQPFFLEERLNPFITYTLLNSQEREALANTEKAKSVESSIVLGLDWAFTEKNTLTLVKNQQQRDKNDFARLQQDEQKKTETLDGFGLGVSHEFETLELLVNYSNVSNNRSSLKNTEKDLHFEVLDVRVNFEF